jgi:RNA polymerase sigma-70 factor (ECF subfamily)
MPSVIAADARRSAPAFTQRLGEFEAEFDAVYTAIRRYGVDRDDAEDLVQAVFLVMWRRWGELDQDRPLRPWLMGVAFKLACEHRKRIGRFVPTAFLDVEDANSRSDERLASAQARRLVARALDRLTEPQRSLIVMHDLDGVPMREIAGLLSVPLFTAYTRLRSARKRFAQEVERLDAGGVRGIVPAPALLRDLGRGRFQPSSALRARVLSRLRADRVLPDEAPPPPATGGRWPLPVGLGAAFFVLVAGVAGGLALRGARRSPPAGSVASSAIGPEGPRRLSLPSFILPARPREPSPPTTEPPPVQERGLVGHWRFDEGAGSSVARDFSGAGNDCIVRSRNPRVSDGWIDGAFGGGLALDGQRWLECPHVQRLAQLGGELTIGLWIKVPPGPRVRQVLVTRQLGVGGDRLFSLRLQAGQLEFLSHVWRALLRRPYAGSDWTHVAAVRDGAGTRLYVDGALVGRNKRTQPGAVGGGTGALIIGGQVNGPEPRRAQDLFRGAVDEVVLYDRALTDSEIDALAANGQPRQSVEGGQQERGEPPVTRGVPHRDDLRRSSAL